ncbi:MAG: thymidine phosphorylase [Actinomycetota bacterium]|nr:thymidine phosphorylase [Actinomycetota bacterium]
MARFDVVDLIRTKRDGGTLDDDQIRWFIDAYTNETVAHEQASALLMAIVWRGMEPNELSTWTAAMLASGERMDLSSIQAPTADKHSTGGVGDKVSLILAPMVAACGAADPMLSGRGLGHTGGTLDKLEAIPGYDVDLSGDEMLRVLADVGCVICSAGPDLAPADRKLYALRDVTGTVESIPLIASSIMSKKIAEGTEALVLDVKVGSGAFLPDISMARELAETMVKLGEVHDVKTSALLTNMDVPLGRTAGNGLEVTESVESLQGKGPNDLMAVTIALAQEMLDLVALKADPAATIEDGSALEKWRAMVSAQGGDPDAKMPEAPERRTYDAPEDGFVVDLDARAIGIAAWRLGAGRARKEDPVSPSAGIVCLKKPGDEVEAGEPILELHADDPDRFENAVAALDGAVTVGPEQPDPPEMILERIRP